MDCGSEIKQKGQTSSGSCYSSGRICCFSQFHIIVNEYLEFLLPLTSKTMQLTYSNIKGFKAKCK